MRVMNSLTKLVVEQRDGGVPSVSSKMWDSSCQEITWIPETLSSRD